MQADSPRIGYVVKRWPRYSETFIVNEILAHEAAGLTIEIFALFPPNDTHFQDTIACVRAPVTYLPAIGAKLVDFWAAIQETAAVIPDLWPRLEQAIGEDGAAIYQGVRLAGEVRRRGIRHLHAHFASIPASVARVASHLAGVPYSFTAHARDIFHESVEPEALRRRLADAAAVVTVSDYNVEYLRAEHGAVTTHVQRIYNGLDLSRFQFAAPEARPPVIVSVGRLIEKKGFADLINACSILERHRRDFVCEIIGEGELELGLRAQAAELGLQGRVRFLGPLPQNDLIRCVQRAAAFAAPCVVGDDGDRDGLPTVLLEAMALGTPCVSTDVTGIPEVLRHDETGLMVPQHDSPRLAAALERLLDDAALRRRLAGRARGLIEARFDVCQNAARLRTLFHEDGRLEDGRLHEWRHEALIGRGVR